MRINDEKLREIERWLVCPECGSDEVRAGSPAYYNSLFICQEDDCEGKVFAGW